jgi:hypothetical protein
MFNTSIRYTHAHASKLSWGLKVFWQRVKSGEVISFDTLKSTGYELVELDTKSFNTLSNRLMDSNKTLPSEAKMFNGWNVGMLKRFSDSSSSGPS